MFNISHKIGVTSNPGNAIKALNTINGLASWWTQTVSGSAEEGEIVIFHFNDSAVKMKITSNTKDTVGWQCIEGPEEWLDTEIEFNIIKEDAELVITFQHRNWKDESPFHYHCSMKWASFLLSLKQYLDNGIGRPFPNDIKITTVGF
jgi:hypothetical protein